MAKISPQFSLTMHDIIITKLIAREEYRMKSNPKTLYLHKPWLGQTILREGEQFRPPVTTKLLKRTRYRGIVDMGMEVKEDMARIFKVEEIISLDNCYKVVLTCLWTQEGDIQSRTYGKEVELLVNFEDAYYSNETPIYMDNGKKVKDENGRDFDIIDLKTSKRYC